MADACNRDRWGRNVVLSSILCNIFNLNRGKNPALKPTDYDPYAKERKRDAAIEVTNMADLKAAFVNMPKGGKTKGKNHD